MKKKVRSPEFKKRVALEALKELKSVKQIASEYEIHPMQVCKWKKELCDNATFLFEPANRKGDLKKSFQEKEAKLHEKIGQLTIELDWVKKSWSYLIMRNAISLILNIHQYPSIDNAN